nr:glycosyltransferase family 2 protein [Longispora sp. (in: high G+C Gram-positive bacteria)]
MTRREVDAVTVVANGCPDDTAAVARAAGVRVVVLSAAWKAAALNAGNAVAIGFPRVYLDAYVRITAADLVARLARIRAGTAQQ